MLKLIIFDWDGTIANSIPQILECKNFLAKKYNLPSLDDDLSKKMIGMSFEKALAMCFPTAPPHLLNVLGNEFHILMQQGQHQSKLFPGAFDTLKALKKQRLKLSIATSKSRTGLDSALHFYSLSTLFDITCCGKEYGEKPSPEMLHYLLENFAVTPQECLMVGDTTVDIEFAKNANIQSIAVTFGAHSKTELKLANPLALVDNWAQLLGIIKNLC